MKNIAHQPQQQQQQHQRNEFIFIVLQFPQSGESFLVLERNF